MQAETWGCMLVKVSDPIVTESPERADSSLQIFSVREATVYARFDTNLQKSFPESRNGYRSANLV